MHGNLSIETPSGWKRRWFVLTDMSISSFSKHKGGRRRNLITLDTVSAIKKMGTVFELTHVDPEHLRFQLCCENPADAEQWVDTIQEELDMRARLMERDEDSRLEEWPTAMPDEPSPSSTIDDPLLKGLMVLVSEVREEAGEVLEKTVVDPSMMRCMAALQALDRRMLKVYNKTTTSRLDLEDGKAAPTGLLPLDVLTKHAVGPWVEEMRQNFEHWWRDSQNDETWEGSETWHDDDSCACAASVVALFQMLAKAVSAFKESGMHAATSGELRRKFVQGIAAAMENYVTHVGTSCGPIPTLTRCLPPKRGTKVTPYPPKKPRPTTEFEEQIETNLAKHYLEELITRLNSLVYAQHQLEESMAPLLLEEERLLAELGTLHKPLSAMQVLDSVSHPAIAIHADDVGKTVVVMERLGSEWCRIRLGGGTEGIVPSNILKRVTLLAPVMTAIESSMREVRSYIAAKVVHNKTDIPFNRRAALLDGLYMTPQNTICNLDRLPAAAMSDMDDILNLLLDRTPQEQRDELLLDVYKSFLEVFEFVLLNHDPWRIYTAQMHDTFEADLQELRDFFSADGQGLPPDRIASASANLDQLLSFCMLGSDYLLEVWQDTKEKQSGRRATAGADDPNLARIALILCHRRDKTSMTFLKKYADETEHSGADAGSKRVSARMLEEKAFKTGWLYFEKLERRMDAVDSRVEKVWRKKWFVLWPNPGLVLQKKDYQRLPRELGEHDGMWLFGFDSQDASAESERIQLSSVDIGVIPLTERVCIELTVRDGGQSKKYRLAAKMDELEGWMVRSFACASRTTLHAPLQL
jgi:hypothetical protein